MQTPSISYPTTREPWFAAVVAACLALAIATAWVILTSAPSSPTTELRDTTAPASAVDPDRGTGDPCSLRLERGGGYLEGLGPPNRCGVPDGTPRIGGRMP